MRLLALAVVVAAAFPLASWAQSGIQVAPGVTVTPATQFMPGQPIAPGIVSGQLAPNQGMSGQGDARGQNEQPLNGPGGITGPAGEAAGEATGKTAAEQGLVDPMAVAAARRFLEDQAALNTPRQRGEVIVPPSLRNPVGKDAVSREWLMNWDLALCSFGMSHEKVAFEASRLSRPEFEAWASRQYEARKADGLRVEVLSRPKE